MENNLGFKELYDVTLKATYNIEVGGRRIEPGEVIAIFDKIQLAQFNEIKSWISANGGFNNRTRVVWNDTKEMKVSFTQGVFSQSQMALLINSKLAKSGTQEVLFIHKREQLECNESSQIELMFVPRKPFVYNTETGEKITVLKQDGNILTINAAPFKNVIVDYEYGYTNEYQTFSIGTNLTDGYLSFTAKTRIKDDVTGQVKTGIINIPKLKLMSDLSMVLGQNASPQMGKFDAVAFPVGNKGSQVVMEFIMLDDDIDSDM